MDTIIEEKIRAIRSVFGNACRIKPSMDELQKWFKKDYNSPFNKGVKCYMDLRFFFKNDKSRNWKTLFENNPWQPIMITYKRRDVIFFRWVNYPKYPEDYFMEDTVNSAWSKNIYPSVINYSDLFKKKIRRLKDKKPTELAVQMTIIDIDDMKGTIQINKDYAFD